jgi:hypothetical protein
MSVAPNTDEIRPQITDGPPVDVDETDGKLPPVDAEKDLADLVPALPDNVTVAGVLCRVNRVKMRELMLLARVVTRGIGENISMVDFSGDDVDSQIMGLLVVAIPEAGDEVLDLLRVLISPVEPIEDDDVRKAFAAEMANPDGMVALEALAVMVKQEAETFGLLAGKFRVLLTAATALWRRQQRTA